LLCYSVEICAGPAGGNFALGHGCFAKTAKPGRARCPAGRCAIFALPSEVRHVCHTYRLGRGRLHTRGVALLGIWHACPFRADEEALRAETVAVLALPSFWALVAARATIVGIGVFVLQGRQMQAATIRFSPKHACMYVYLVSWQWSQTQSLASCQLHSKETFLARLDC
jgi:hypothetical protein